ncbi:MAG: PPOX class F420-dependent oxidoreductase [Gammaproteobacteria bacterium]
MSVESVGQMRFVSLATFRKSGAEVRTPVWIAAAGGTLYVYSEGQAGKVKRIRANGKARLAHCDMRGKLLGDFIEARGRVVDDAAERTRAFGALKAKYGWQMTIANVLSRVSGKFSKRAVLAFDLAAGE